ncbi:MAG: TonB-dependent receptor [Gemmatimonadetes bacterium]|nr:TonB-dependent receptor [Gemmatimonadota bacterium]
MTPVRSRAYAALSAALAMALGSPPAHAQVPDSVAADSVPYSVEGITIAVVRPVSTTGGASAVVVKLDSMPSLPAPTMEQVMRAMPLIVIRRNSRGEAQPALRGADDRQVAVLVDGVPLSLGWDHRSDLSAIPLTAAREITLVRGLPSVLHGPNVLGGVVEVNVARGATRQPPPEPLSFSGSVDHLGGRAGAVTGGRLFENLSSQWVVRAGAGYQERPGFALAGGLPGAPAFLTADGDLRLNSDSQRFDGFVAARYLGDGGQWLSLSASGATMERGVPPEAHILDPRLWRYGADQRLVAALTGGTGHHETAWGEGDLEASVGVHATHQVIDEFDSPAYDRHSGGEVGDDRTVTLRLLGDHTLGERGELRAAATYADVSHDERIDGGSPTAYRQRLWSLGSEVEWRFEGLAGLPGFSQTRLTLGAAADGADTPESGDKPPLGRLWDWGSRLGFTSVYGGGSLLVHGGVSRRTRFPALRELYSGALGRFEPNPDLRPEVLTGGELGFTLRSGVNELQVVGFHQRLADGIVRASVQTPEGSRFQRVNQAAIRSTGLELMGSGALGPLAVSGDLTLQRTRGYDDEGGSFRLEYEPAWVGKLGTQAPLPWEVVAWGDVRFMADQYCENPEVGGLEAFSTDPNVDVGVRRSFSSGAGRSTLSRLEVSLAVDNVGDAAVFDQCGLPQPGRTFRMQMRLW